MANTRAERLGSNYKPIITTKKFTEEEFARFGGVQSRLDAVVYDTTLRLSERG